RQQPALINRKDPILLHENVSSPHVASTTVQKLHQRRGIEILPHPLYSPDLSLTDFHFFRSLSNFLAKRRRFKK
ncbi:Histone-lysine N-methyltransferase SETMAR, partial [Habropoda laboriosa]